MDKETFTNLFDPCDTAVAWMNKQPERNMTDLWEKCSKPEWLHWMRDKSYLVQIIFLSNYLPPRSGKEYTETLVKSLTRQREEELELFINFRREFLYSFRSQNYERFDPKCPTHRSFITYDAVYGIEYSPSLDVTRERFTIAFRQNFSCPNLDTELWQEITESEEAKAKAYYQHLRNSLREETNENEQD